MTRRQACEFFYRWGNVGMSMLVHEDAIDIMVRDRPTPGQLADACNHAIRTGQPFEKVQEARRAIEREEEADGP